MIKKLLLIAVGLLSILFTLPALTQDTTVSSIVAPECTVYLDRQYGITFEGDIAQDTYTNALTSILGEVEAELPEGIDTEGWKPDHWTYTELRNSPSTAHCYKALIFGQSPALHIRA